MVVWYSNLVHFCGKATDLFLIPRWVSTEHCSFWLVTDQIWKKICLCKALILSNTQLPHGWYNPHSNTEPLEWEPRGGSWRWLESWSASPMGKVWENWGSWTWRREVSVVLMLAFQYLKRAYRKPGEGHL